ncbi:unnamed protein product, partial [Closterium sp. NIES-64]
MLESLVFSLVGGYLSHYLKNFHKEQLRIGVWRRKIGSLSLQLSMKRLGREPCVSVTISDVLIVMAPRADHEWSEGPAVVRERAAKRAALAAAEVVKMSEQGNGVGASALSYFSAVAAFEFGLHLDHLSVAAAASKDPLTAAAAAAAAAADAIASASASALNTTPAAGGPGGGLGRLLPSFDEEEGGGMGAKRQRRRGVDEQRGRGREQGRGKGEEGSAAVANNMLHPLDASIRLVRVSLEEHQYQDVLLLADALNVLRLRERYGRFRPAALFSSSQTPPTSGTKPADSMGDQQGGSTSGGSERVRALWSYALNAVLFDVRQRLYRRSFLYLPSRLYVPSSPTVYASAPFLNPFFHTRCLLAPLTSLRAARTEWGNPSASKDSAEDFSAEKDGRGDRRKGKAAQQKQQQQQRGRGWLNWLSQGMLGAGGSDASAAADVMAAVSDRDLEELYRTLDSPFDAADGDNGLDEPSWMSTSASTSSSASMAMDATSASPKAMNRSRSSVHTLSFSESSSSLDASIPEDSSVMGPSSRMLPEASHRTTHGRAAVSVCRLAFTAQVADGAAKGTLDASASFAGPGSQGMRTGVGMGGGVSSERSRISPSSSQEDEAVRILFPLLPHSSLHDFLPPSHPSHPSFHSAASSFASPSTVSSPSPAGHGHLLMRSASAAWGLGRPALGAGLGGPVGGGGKGQMLPRTDSRVGLGVGVGADGRLALGIGAIAAAEHAVAMGGGGERGMGGGAEMGERGYGGESEVHGWRPGGQMQAVAARPMLRVEIEVHSPHSHGHGHGHGDGGVGGGEVEDSAPNEMETTISVAVEPVQAVVGVEVLKRVGMFFSHPTTVPTHQEQVIASINSLDSTTARATAKSGLVLATRKVLHLHVDVASVTIVVPHADTYLSARPCPLLVLQLASLHISSIPEPPERSLLAQALASSGNLRSALSSLSHSLCCPLPAPSSQVFLVPPPPRTALPTPPAPPVPHSFWPGLPPGALGAPGNMWMGGGGGSSMAGAGSAGEGGSESGRELPLVEEFSVHLHLLLCALSGDPATTKAVVSAALLPTLLHFTTFPPHSHSPAAQPFTFRVLFLHSNNPLPASGPIAVPHRVGQLQGGMGGQGARRGTADEAGNGGGVRSGSGGLTSTPSWSEMLHTILQRDAAKVPQQLLASPDLDNTRLPLLLLEQQQQQQHEAGGDGSGAVNEGGSSSRDGKAELGTGGISRVQSRRVAVASGMDVLTGTPISDVGVAVGKITVRLDMSASSTEPLGSRSKRSRAGQSRGPANGEASGAHVITLEATGLDVRLVQRLLEEHIYATLHRLQLTDSSRPPSCPTHHIIQTHLPSSPNPASSPTVTTSHPPTPASLTHSILSSPSLSFQPSPSAQLWLSPQILSGFSTQTDPSAPHMLVSRVLSAPSLPACLSFSSLPMPAIPTAGQAAAPMGAALSGGALSGGQSSAGNSASTSHWLGGENVRLAGVSAPATSGAAVGGDGAGAGECVLRVEFGGSKRHHSQGREGGSGLMGKHTPLQDLSPFESPSSSFSSAASSPFNSPPHTTDALLSPQYWPLADVKHVMGQSLPATWASCGRISGFEPMALTQVHQGRVCLGQAPHCMWMWLFPACCSWSHSHSHMGLWGTSTRYLPAPSVTAPLTHAVVGGSGEPASVSPLAQHGRERGQQEQQSQHASFTTATSPSPSPHITLPVRTPLFMSVSSDSPSPSSHHTGKPRAARTAIASPATTRLFPLTLERGIAVRGGGGAKQLRGGGSGGWAGGGGSSSQTSPLGGKGKGKRERGEGESVGGLGSGSGEGDS